mmetsp:Transcript_31446/g.98763  ORF Transcript_31446/g.98763 Transcript_31446/m.98763 type:complete len:200 (-) Transcript_31446:335-934(-)
MALSIQHDILGLEVAVHAEVLVHEVDALADLREVARGPRLGQPAGGLRRAEAAQGAAGAVLQHHVHVRLVFQAREQPEDVPVLKAALYSDLALQLRQHVPDVQGVLLDHLQGHVLAASPVAQPSDYSEGALAEQVAISLELCGQLRRQLRRRLRETDGLQRRHPGLCMGALGLLLLLQRRWRLELRNRRLQMRDRLLPF